MLKKMMPFTPLRAWIILKVFIWTDEGKEAILELALLEASTKQKNFRIPKKTNWNPEADGEKQKFQNTFVTSLQA